MFLWLKDIKVTVRPTRKYQGNYATREFPFTEGQLVGAFVALLLGAWFVLACAMKADQAALAREPIYYEISDAE